MGKYILTGVDGNLGSIAADWMLANRRSDQELVFTSYSPHSIPVETRNRWAATEGLSFETVDYDDVPSMKKVFVGAEVVGFISTWAFGRRSQQTANIIEACKASGVSRICYTSFIGAGLGEIVKDFNDVPFLPRDHAINEKLIRESGLQYNLQRDYLYADNFIPLFAQSWKFCGDKWLNNTHGQAAAYVSRADCGRVFGALILGRGEPNTVYNITGPEAFTNKEAFDFICAQTGYKAEYVDLPDEEFMRWWDSKGLPWDMATGDFSKLPMKLCMDDLTCCGEIVSKLFMIHTSDAVEKLTGQKPEHWKDVILKYKHLIPKP